MDLSLFFTPVVVEVENEEFESPFGQSIQVHSSDQFPDLENVDIAILGVKDGRSSVNNAGTGNAPEPVRKELYKLQVVSGKISIVDLGNIEAGNTVGDTYYAVSSVINHLVKKDILPIIIGGGQDLTYANYLGYEKLEQIVNVVTIDSKINVGDIDSEPTSNNFLSHILLTEPNFLFNYCNIGSQGHFISPTVKELIKSLYFDSFRLGEINECIEDTEPFIRNADIVSFDISSIKSSYAQGNFNASPNGLSGDQACRLARYAGISDKLSSIGFYEYNPEYDQRNQTAQLVAQMIWYCIDGFYSRKQEFPVGNKDAYTKYLVHINKHDIVFYKSEKSNRWWLEVPYSTPKKGNYKRHLLIPCSYNDYLVASNEELPEIWINTIQKIG